MAILPPTNGGTPTPSSRSPPRIQTARSRTKKLSDFDAYAFSSQVSYSPPRSSPTNSPQSRSTGSPLSPRSAEKKRLSEREVYDLSAQVVYSPMSNNSPNYSPARSDTMSDYNTVASHKTSSTTSTRSRRPGQAKVRLQQQQIATSSHQSVANHSVSSTSRSSSRSRQRGWHETMKQAATAANRKWEPRHGFEPQHADARSYHAASVADTQSMSTLGASSTPPRNQYQAPLMIDIEGENERMNVYDHFFDASRYGEI
mmetsp:Transcript_35737/g.86482  ORF Transcript_35737/g.86482 Transcript_35737/m.86482 type:complete len:257 (-) Transcript_35737:90-860(-)|eukprot:CAMPEP_0113625394 /NCGR_PEP_ID=MMETSP0017_2-20120614/13118_1 /TAXON_ID=2856 /ORGANISM="Cylindrotheca closterium" /LENGTH=256 /DNA_ID=CAMNT_0000535509 /DNA_START=54 /DNA_END=824 /DNA_ORIENTATION=+ /assembly_acc=CAM_ASM_000147